MFERNNFEDFLLLFEPIYALTRIECIPWTAHDTKIKINPTKTNHMVLLISYIKKISITMNINHKSMYVGITVHFSLKKKLWRNFFSLTKIGFLS